MRVGPIALAAHITGGHSRGCTTWTFQVREGERLLDGLPEDIWVTSHAREWARYRKFAARDTASSPVAPFIDRAGYQAYIDSGEARFRRRLAAQERKD